MIDFSSLPEGTPVWLVTFLVICSAILVFSEKAAKIKGPLGSLSRWWESRQSDEIDRIQAANDKIEKAAQRRYGQRLKSLESSMERLSADLDEERKARRRERKEMADRYESQIARVQQERDLFAAWSEHILAWWRTQAQWLAQHGVTLPPPSLSTFSEFRDQWIRANTGQHTGSQHTVKAHKEG